MGNAWHKKSFMPGIVRSRRGNDRYENITWSYFASFDAAVFLWGE